MKAFRALLHKLRTTGLDGATWQGSADRILARALGYARFLVMVDTVRFLPMLKEIESFAESQGFKPEIRNVARPASTKAKPCSDQLIEKNSNQVPTPTEQAKKPAEKPFNQHTREPETKKPTGMVSRFFKKLFGL